MLPPNHALRSELNHEVHARPSDALKAPLRISYLAMLSDSGAREAEWRHLLDLVRRFGGHAPERPSTHFSADLGGFSIRWERHTEFTRYTFITPGSADAAFDPCALQAVPADWIAAISGEIMVASHGALLAYEERLADPEDVAARWFDGNVLIGSRIGDGAAVALTDFRVRADGFSRFVLFDRHLTPRQAGRSVQRMVEIDTYRMMALLALPVARELSPFLSLCERELSQVTTVLESANDEDEATLLDRLTRLEAHIESREAQNHYRFGAAAAYYDLVRQRIGELRELRIAGLQTFGEFSERRLAPAMNTCRAVAGRQESLSQRVARANQLLATRVDLTRERQSQALLESMNRRVKAQLQLQQTVEGLSIAAVSYYVIGLLSYALKGVKAAGADINPDFILACSIPVVAILAALSIAHIRESIIRKARG
jgi:uncharacterized membrane-anchored protein